MYRSSECTYVRTEAASAPMYVQKQRVHVCTYIDAQKTIPKTLLNIYVSMHSEPRLAKVSLFQVTRIPTKKTQLSIKFYQYWRLTSKLTEIDGKNDVCVKNVFVYGSFFSP